MSSRGTGRSGARAPNRKMNFGSGPGRAPIVPNAIVDTNRDSTTLLDNARAIKNAGMLVYQARITSGNHVLKDGLNNLATSVLLYQNLLDMMEPSPEKDAIDKERTDALAAAYDLIVIIRARGQLDSIQPSATSTVASLTNSLANVSLKDAPLQVNVQTESPEDVAIVKKIEAAIVTRSCGFRSWKDYAGSQELSEFFQTVAVDRFKYQQFQDAHPNSESIMLFGPPGTGKTLAAEAVASMLEQYGAHFISISAADIKGRFVGESEKSLKYLFAVARSLTMDEHGNPGKRPCVVFMDEIDGLIDNSGTTSGGGTGLLSQFNAEMAGFKGVSNKGLIVIAATNYPDKIPPAAFQRFTHRIFVGLPSLDDVREIVMNKIHKMGWARINLITGPTEPKWMQTIDWQRKTFISNFLDKEPAEAYGPNSEVFWKTAEFDSDKSPNHRYASFKKGETFFDYHAGGSSTKVPWDFVDFMTLYLHSHYYAPREIDGIFAVMMLKAEQRSVYFATKNPVNASKTYYQKWILERKQMNKPIERNGMCVYEKVDRFALIPLWYTVYQEDSDASEGSKKKKSKSNDADETAFLSTYLQSESEREDVILGNTFGYQRKTKPDGSFEDVIVPKYHFTNNNTTSDYSASVVVTKVTINNATPVGEQLRGRHRDAVVTTTRDYSIVRKQTSPVDLSDYKEVALEQFKQIFVPTEKYSPSEKERIGTTGLPRVLGIAQINPGDFMQAINIIKPIAVDNVKLMIEYAEKYGRSVKGGADIAQLKKQAEVMVHEADNSVERYGKIFQQMVNVLSSAYGFSV